MAINKKYVLHLIALASLVGALLLVPRSFTRLLATSPMTLPVLGLAASPPAVTVCSGSTASDPVLPVLNFVMWAATSEW